MKVAQELLQSMGLRAFVPLVAACPGCGRTTSTTFQELARDIQDFIRDEMPEWKRRYPGVETLTVAVMGCIVNGPGESKHADIGISLPGTGEAPAAPVFIDGKKATTLRGPGAAAEFKQMVLDYIERRFGQGARPRRGGVGGDADRVACAVRAGGRLFGAAVLAEDVPRKRRRRFVDRLLEPRLRCRAPCQAPGAEGRGDDALDCAARGRERRTRRATYRAKITALVRDKPDTFANPENARCVASGATLSCFTDGFFIGQFSIERAGKNRKLALRGAGENLALVPGVDLGAFIVLSSQESGEHAVPAARRLRRNPARK